MMRNIALGHSCSGLGKSGELGDFRRLRVTARNPNALAFLAELDREPIATERVLRSRAPGWDQHNSGGSEQGAQLALLQSA